MWRQTLYMRESPLPGVFVRRLFVFSCLRLTACTEIVCFVQLTVSSGILMRKIPANAQKKQALRFAQKDRTETRNFSNRYVQVPPLRCASAGMTTHFWFTSNPKMPPPGCKREKAWPGPCLSYSLANYGVILCQA